MYRERMNSYYPRVIQSILEFQAIIDAEYPEFELLEEAKDKVMSNAYLTTMDLDRVAQWEKILNIKPIEDSTLEDRRDTIVARIRGQGKLNSELINVIVKTFTGGTANSWVADSTLYVEVTPPRGNKQYLFANVEQELAQKIPAHLSLSISRNYYDWQEVKASYPTWQDVKNDFGTWNDVYIFVPFK